MESWQWIALGSLLLLVELLVDPEFYLFFVGAPAIALGLIGLTPLALPLWGQWLLYAFLVVTCVALSRSGLARMMRGSEAEPEEGVIGELAVTEAALAPGELGRVELRGASWAARNAGEEPLGRSTPARVVSRSGLTLLVRAENS